MPDYKLSSVLIFAALIILVGLLLVWPNAWLALIGMAVLPIFVMAQVLAVLKSTDVNEGTFSDDQWYENR